MSTAQMSDDSAEESAASEIEDRIHQSSGTPQQQTRSGHPRMDKNDIISSGPLSGSVTPSTPDRPLPE